MRGRLPLEPIAVWRLWKRLTSWFGVVPIDLVDRAMDRRTRSGVRWRYHVWFFAWIVALIAYVPAEMVIAFLLSRDNGPLTPLRSLAIFGPTVVLSVLMFYCGIRDWLCAARIPAAKFIAPIPDQTWQRKKKKKAPGSEVHPQEESHMSAAASSHAWQWIGAVLLVVSVVGRFLTHH